MALVLAASAAALAAALASVLIGAAAVFLAGAAIAGHRFVTALAAATVALNPGWGLLFILATPYVVLALTLAYRARRDFDTAP